ncbi:MAG TPA: Stf0 family sulfotransferase, partial [Elusimicrobiota bacterium]|nr:Stf0 family sulfotransferase [Elusimicrobiota bacterium]
ESLNAYSVRYLSKMYRVSTFKDYIERLYREQTDGIHKLWGLKASWQQLAMLLRCGVIPNLLRPTILFVRRRDVIAQTISLHIANKTQEWKRTSASAGDTMPRGKLKYDAQEILEVFRGLMHSYNLLEQIFSVAGLPIVRCDYETVLARPLDEIPALTERLLGRAHLPIESAVNIQIQRDEINEQFKARFTKDLRSLRWIAESV